MLLQYWALLNPLHGSLMRSCIVAAGIHIYAFPFSFVQYLLTLQIFNILFCIEIFSNCSNPAHKYSQLATASGIVYCHTGTFQQNLDSIKIIDFRNGFSLWPGLIFAPLTRPTPATNNHADKIRPQVLVPPPPPPPWKAHTHFLELSKLLGKIWNPLEDYLRIWALSSVWCGVNLVLSVVTASVPPYSLFPPFIPFVGVKLSSGSSHLHSCSGIVMRTELLIIYCISLCILSQS